MLRHITKFWGGFAAVAVAALTLLNTDIPKALKQSDESFAYIAQTTFGVVNPPAHAVTRSWAHPWFVLLIVVILFTLGVGISWLIEYVRKSRKKVAVNITEGGAMPDGEKELMRRLIEQLAANQGHTVSSVNQSGGITAGHVTINTEDNSLKAKIRSLLKDIDGRIIGEIDGGMLDIETRMTSRQFGSLSNLAATSGSAQYIAKADVTGRFTGCTINNGTLGPVTSEPLQIRVAFKFTRDLIR
ncbi:MAG: hypothetical protein JWM65_3751 [Sphingomonas bacterium]|nr:hypothetical protein [Sphingomonas bacterium]